MDPARYSIRPFIDSDYEPAAQIFAEDNPGLVQTADELRHFDALHASEPGHLNLRLAVERRPSGEMVACGSLAHSPFAYHPKKFWVAAHVERAHRQAGIGTALYDRLEREAVRRRAITLWSGVMEGDPAGLRFFEKHHFHEVERIWTSRLDLAGVDRTSLGERSGADPLAGIRITTLSAEGPQRPEVRRRLYELNQLTSRDAPRMGEYTPTSYEVFLRFEIESPFLVADGYYIAAAADQYVGMTSLEKNSDRPDTLRIGFTGTHPDFRGRGIAAELKRRSILYAVGQRYRYLVTNNNSHNRPIWAVNEKLGFRRERTWIQGEKNLSPTPAPAS
jgi:GNAT superfamily N-acetyltransferase